jgi:hypothetical protein
MKVFVLFSSPSEFGTGACISHAWGPAFRSREEAEAEAVNRNSAAKWEDWTVQDVELREEEQPRKLDCTSDELYTALKKGGLTEIIYEGDPGPGQIKPLAHGRCEHGLAWHKWENGSATNCCSLCPVPT